MSTAPQPVFLSYASQDAEPAQRICEAMRAAGIEVWFDQSELRGGDAWDQAIRRQIKECALFIPLISANTNARQEGYFRLEWRLAVDRSNLMADDATFLMPVAIEGSTEGESRVPERFRDVQWMRLGKQAPEAIAARVAKVLAGGATPASAAKKPKRELGKRLHIWSIVGAVIVLVAVVRPMVMPKKEREGKATRAIATEPARISEAAKLSQGALDTLRTLNYTREALTNAGEVARRATELEPTLASAWGARARIEAVWVHRHWDTSEARRRSAQEFAKRAMAIDPEEPNALYSLGMVLRYQRALTAAEAMFKRGLKATPDDSAMRGALGETYRLQGRIDEAIVIHEENMRRNPRDPLHPYALALIHGAAARIGADSAAQVDLSLKYFEQSVEIQPLVYTLLWKAILQGPWKGDFAGAHATLDRLAAMPHEEATEDRAIFFRMWIALLDRKPAQALAAAALTTSNYFSDATVPEPVAWMKALAHTQAGRASSAAEEWRAAEAVLRSRLASSPEPLLTQAELAITLAMLGLKDEAARQFTRYEATMRDQGRPGTLAHVRYYAAMGDAKKMVAAWTEGRKTSWYWFTDEVLTRDPWFDRVRDKPEFKALLRQIDIK